MTTFHDNEYGNKGKVLLWLQPFTPDESSPPLKEVLSNHIKQQLDRLTMTGNKDMGMLHPGQ